MPQDAAPYPPADADRLEAAADEAIAACGGNPSIGSGSMNAVPRKSIPWRRYEIANRKSATASTSTCSIHDEGIENENHQRQQNSRGGMRHG
jgi:hypothetical protein